jgi:hypothetical protein
MNAPATTPIAKRDNRDATGAADASEFRESALLAAQHASKAAYHLSRYARKGVLADILSGDAEPSLRLAEAPKLVLEIELHSGDHFWEHERRALESLHGAVSDFIAANLS